MGDFACGSGLPVKMHRLWTSDYDRTKACRKKYKRNSKKSLKSCKIRAIVLFLTVSKNKIAAMPENIGVVAILTVVLNYSILFPSFTFFLDGFHLAFGDKFEICIKTTDLM